jgi:hypothetical protein
MQNDLAVNRLHPIFATRLTQTSIQRRPVRLSARTAPFHGAKTGSIPVPATKPLTQVGGFFVSRMCRKLVFVNRRGAKKPFERGAFEWKALGKANGKGRQCEALAVPDLKNF